MSPEHIINLKILSRHNASAMQLAVQTFFLSREAMRVTPTTIVNYQSTIQPFVVFLEGQGITKPEDITANHIRAFLVGLERRGLRDTSVATYARNVKALIRFWHTEGIIADNPTSKVKTPRIDKRILPALSPDDVKRLLTACDYTRDAAIILALLDTGCRASEFVALDVGDVDMKTGAVKVRLGKGRKSRVTFLGARARKALLRCFMERGDVQPDAPLWVSQNNGERLTRWGLGLLLQRLGKRAGVAHCSPHSFRRTFALWSLRGGMDIFSLQRLMGHSSLVVLRQYLAQTEGDLQQAHKRFGPADTML